MFSGIGDFPIGGFPLADSLSVGDPLHGILSEPSTLREYLLRATPTLKLGSCLEFDGDLTEYVSYGDILDQGSSDSFTIRILLCSDNVSQTGIIASKTDNVVSGGNGWGIYCISGQLTILVRSGATKTVSVSATPYLDGNVHRVTMVVDRTNNRLRMMVDGVITGTDATLSGVGSLSNSNALMVGNHADGSSTFDGRLDDFQFWPVAREQEDEFADMFRELTTAESASCSLYSKFNEGTGNTTADSSGNAHTGTITSAKWYQRGVGPLNVDLSSGGYVSSPSDTPYKLFVGALGAPYRFTTALTPPEFRGGASVTVGEVKINNPDRAHDALASLDWLGCVCDLYVGRRYDALSLFTKFFSARAAGTPVKRLDSLSVPVRDLRFRLQRKLQQETYMGTGQCIRFSSAGPDRVTFGDILPPGTGSWSAEILFRSSNVGAGTRRVLFCKTRGLSPNRAGVALYYDTSDNLCFRVRNIANTSGVDISVAGAQYLNDKWHRASVVIDRTAELAHLFVDGALVSTSSSLSGFGSIDSAATFQLTAGTDSSAADGFNGDLDDFRVVVGTALTQQQIRDRMHRELTAAEAADFDLYATMNEGSLTVVSDSSGNGNNGTLVSGTWVGSLEGDISLAGKAKQLVFGPQDQCPLVLVDSPRNIYQVSYRGIQAVNAARIKCDDAIFDNDYSDIFGAGPAAMSAGKYCTDLSRGLIRFKDLPDGLVTADVEGDDAGTLGYVSSAVDIARKIVTDFGEIDDPNGLDIPSFAVLEGKTTAEVCYVFPEAIECDKALDEVMSKAVCYWTQSRLMKAVVGRIDPPEDQVPTVFLTADDVIDPTKSGKFEAPPQGVRVKRVLLGYNRYGAVADDADVFGGATPAQREDFTSEYRFVDATDHDGPDDGDEITVYTNIRDKGAAQAEADRILAMRKVPRETLPLILENGLLTHFIGTVVRFTYDRYDYEAGKNFVIYGVNEDSGQYGSPDTLGVDLYG